MWKIQDAIEQYFVADWGAGFFNVNEKGHVVVHPNRNPDQAFDLKVLIDELQGRGIQLPILIRFPDILKERIQEIQNCFRNAISEYEYKGSYQGVYPIKVNQQRQVVESIVEAGRPFHLGLEAGSKPELLTVLALLDNPEALIVCNGYEDDEFIELGLLGRKLGTNVIHVVEKFSELPAILRIAEKLGVTPSIGLRAKLSTKGAGRWEASGGDRSKFGLGAVDIVRAIDCLKEAGQLENLRLLHFHLGSQISSIRNLREALHEVGRYYIELRRMGANVQYLDVGGGLAVDYDGSRTNFQSSANYSVQEYANTVVYEVKAICEEGREAHPILVTEAGRAITAYHSVLVTNVLGVTEVPSNSMEKISLQNAPRQVAELWDVFQSVNNKNYQESYHDLQYLREQMLSLFSAGTINLEWRARGESILWAALHKIWKIASHDEYLPEELEGLEQDLSDIYFCNMSVFQSLPDSWAIGQIFPIMPIHRLDEAPTRNAVLADISCDSDGKIVRFVGLRDVNKTIMLHPLRENEDYMLGFFLVGAYQEILGDLHNLFGDNNAVNISWDEDIGTYQIDHVEDGDTVTEVLNYVQQNRDELVNRFRLKMERAVRRRDVSIEESRIILDSYRAGFDGYTYME